jgi:hypothetical protein
MASLPPTAAEGSHYDSFNTEPTPAEEPHYDSFSAEPKPADPTPVIAATTATFGVRNGNTIETPIATAPPSYFTSTLDSTRQNFSEEYPLNIVIWLLTALIIFIPYRYMRTRKEKRDLDERSTRFMDNLCETKEWPVLIGAFDMFLRGEVSTSPLAEDCETSLREWPEKQYLRGLLHMGVIPLKIQDGGVDTRTVSGEGAWTPSMWQQGKKRACFEFLVPMAKGYSYEPPGGRDRRRDAFCRFVNALLDNEDGWHVCVSNELPNDEVDSSVPPPDAELPLERGATSWFETLLPFLPDKTLQLGQGEKNLSFASYAKEIDTAPPLLTASAFPLVRIEVPHCDRKRLDKWVHGQAREAGMEAIWTEWDLRDWTRKYLLRNLQ